MPTEYQNGDRVEISVKSFLNIKNSNRSILAFPSDSYVDICFGLMMFKTLGTVQCRWFPGYEVNVKFDNGQVLQMKDHWIEKIGLLGLNNENRHDFWNRNLLFSLLDETVALGHPERKRLAYGLGIAVQESLMEKGLAAKVRFG